MKIGILIDELISGGFQKVAIMEAKYFQKMGYEVFLVVLHRAENEGYKELIKENKIKVIYLSDRLPFYLRINFRFPFFAFFSFFHIFYPFFIHKYMKKEEFDIFIAHGTYTAFSSIAISTKLKIPYICFVHDSVTYILNQKYKNKFLGNFLGILIPVANKIDKMIVKNAKLIIAFPEMINKLKTIVPNYQYYQPIYNGCEPIDERKINYNKKNYAIAVTKWDQGKNFEFLLSVWLNLDKKIPLKVIGPFYPGKLQIEFRKKILEYKLGDYIKLVGAKDEVELNKYYSEAKFLIHPCKEAFGMTILEASAKGCPAIFTKNSGVAELFSEDIKMRLPNENDIKKYKNTINCLAKLTQQEHRKLINSYYKVAMENSWKNHCKKLIGYLN